MTNFSTNQVIQFYALEGVTAEVKPYTHEKAAVITFTKGGETRVSDKIQNVMWGKVTTAAALAKSYKNINITTDTVVVGQDYVVRVSYPEVRGLGIEGWTTKTAVAHAKTANAQDIYDEIEASLKVALGTDGVLEVSADDGINIFPADVTKGYKRGVRPVVMPDFKVETNLIIVEGEETPWATVTVGDAGLTAVPSGYRVADMEYFAMGERGDQYRMAGYPDVIDTDYLVDPTGAYNVLVVHYAYKGANDTSYNSEKDLIIVSKTLKDLTDLVTTLQTVFEAPFSKVDAGENAGETAL